MNHFENDAEKLAFLKKYNLVSPTSTDLPTLYYFAPAANSPVTCEVIGYDAIYDSWAVITIKANDKVINIHSDYLLEMKRSGNAFKKNNNLDNYVVFDIETTGTNNRQDEIIEISAIKFTPQGMEEFSELVYIESIIPINVSLLTGITNDMLTSADPIEIVLPKFLSFIENYTLIGHNLKAFDIHFINRACRNLHLPEVKNDIIDTLHLSRKKLPQLKNHQLSTICNYYKIDTSNAHRALSDCYMCNECYIRLLAEVPPSSKKNSTSLPDENFDSIFQSILDNIIDELELPKNGLILQANKGKKKKTTSIFINEPPFPPVKENSSKLNTTQSVLNYETSGHEIILNIPHNIYDLFPAPYNVLYKEKKLFVKLFFPPDHPDLFTYVKKIIYFKVKNYTSSAAMFGCCDRFIECSDAKKCVHENKLYSTSCMYRINLESGKIFYGKNRNIK